MLRCAYAQGTSALRSHLDSIPPQTAISFGVFRETRADRAGQIDLQAACLLGIENVPDAAGFNQTADVVAASGGVLGVVSYPVPRLVELLTTFFDAADARGLEVDFHVDETLDPSSNTLRVIAEMVLARGFKRPVIVGHLCSLSAMPEAEALATLDLVAKAGINVVSLPADRAGLFPARQPLHESRAGAGGADGRPARDGRVRNF